jgi:ABC-type bacteriocin/lantibiotic exporter with double-glycine peptidase domain
MMGLLTIALSIADVFFVDLRRMMTIILGQSVDRQISLEIMARILGARMDIAGRNTGEILNMTEQADKIKIFIIDIIPSAVFEIGSAIIAAGMIFVYSAYCGVGLLLIIAGSFLLAKNILHSLRAHAQFQFKSRAEKQGNMAETVGGLATIKALAIEPGRFRLWGAKSKTSINAYGSTAQIHRRFSRMIRLSQHLLTLTVVGIGGFEMMHGLLSVGELFAILILRGKVMSPLLSSADVARQFQEVAVALKELGRLIDAPPERANVPMPVRTLLTGGISFSNVVYRYNANSAPAINGISLRLPETGLIAIIGRNGSGKSTMLRLCQGLLRDFEGSVELGGRDIRSYHPRWLRSQMAVVNQDTVLFAGTVRQNVSCWTTGVSDAGIEQALRLAGAWEFVSEFLDKLDTQLSENGANLSGGQRQRLSVARAMLRDPKIIFLDEPTDFLDAEAAVNLEQQLSAWGQGRLMILVSHHLAATRLADMIVVMDKGTVAAQGRHVDLLQESPLYGSLWNDYLRGSGVEQPAQTNGAESWPQNCMQFWRQP